MPYSADRNGTPGGEMTSSTASDAQHHDLGAIEAAVKETARGRAFLAHYARRVQQSDTLTMLAMLGRLERMADELAARIVELEAGVASPPGRPVSLASNSLPGSPASDPRIAGTAEPPQRLDDLAAVLGTLNHHAVQLATQCAGAGGQNDPASSMEIDARALALPASAQLPSGCAGDAETTDEDVLDKIAQALAT